MWNHITVYTVLTEEEILEEGRYFFFWLVQMAFIAICYMYFDLFALQHIADRPGESRTYDAHQSLRFDLLMFHHGDVSVGHL